MREAVIVSYARTGLAKSGRGGFNITPPMSLAAHAIKHAVERAGVAKDYVEDCYLGNCAHGAPNIGRQAALLAGLAKSTGGVSVNRFCSSGLQTIAMAANSIRSEGSDCIVAGGVESISVPGGPLPKEVVDPELLNIFNQKNPQKYKVADIKVTGNKYFDQALLISVAGISVGDEITIPGGDNFAKAINKLWVESASSGNSLIIGSQVSASRTRT